MSLPRTLFGWICWTLLSACVYVISLYLCRVLQNDPGNYALLLVCALSVLVLKPKEL